MKLLLITAIKEFESEIKNILVKSEVKSFTYNTVKGFKNDAQSNVVDNWFASSYAETDSLFIIHRFCTGRKHAFNYYKNKGIQFKTGNIIQSSYCFGRFGTAILKT